MINYDVITFYQIYMYILSDVYVKNMKEKLFYSFISTINNEYIYNDEYNCSAYLQFAIFKK